MPIAIATAPAAKPAEHRHVPSDLNRHGAESTSIAAGELQRERINHGT